jgi:ribulose kinase
LSWNHLLHPIFFIDITEGKDDSLSDLARKYHLTLEAIALQTRHIIEEMNTNGHKIRSIYVSGGQAGNRALMRLFADVCNKPVVLPFSHSGAVVLGAAMLGRFAAEMAAVDGEMLPEARGECLWKIMVCGLSFNFMRLTRICRLR